MKKKQLTNKAGEVRELLQKDMAQLRPISEVLPPELLEVLPKRTVGQRGAQKKPKKVPITLRYSPEVIEHFRSTGPGWQVRIDQALINWIKEHESDTPSKNRKARATKTAKSYKNRKTRINAA